MRQALHNAATTPQTPTCPAHPTKVLGLQVSPMGPGNLLVHTHLLDIIERVNHMGEMTPQTFYHSQILSVK